MARKIQRELRILPSEIKIRKEINDLQYVKKIDFK